VLVFTCTSVDYNELDPCDCAQRNYNDDYHSSLCRRANSGTILFRNTPRFFTPGWLVVNQEDVTDCFVYTEKPNGI
jgi:hypothetical protein